MDQRQRQRVSVFFGHAVFAVVGNQHAEVAALVLLIRPFVDVVHEIGVAIRDSAPDRARIGVEDSRIVGRRQRKAHKEVGGALIPAYPVVKAQSGSALGQGNGRLKHALLILFGDFQRNVDRSPVNHFDLRRAGKPLRPFLQILIVVFPGGPDRTRVGVEFKRNRRGEQLSVQLLVEDGTDFSRTADPHPQAVILQNTGADLQGGGGPVPFRADVDHREGKRRKRRPEDDAAVLLRRRHSLAVEEHAAVLAVIGQTDGFAAGEGRGIADHVRPPLATGIQLSLHGGKGVLQLAREDVGGQQLVVVGIAVGGGDRGAGEVVVELMPQEGLPARIQTLLGIGFPRKVLGRAGRPLGAVRQTLVFAVETLHRGVAGHSPVAVGDEQRPLIHRQSRDLLRRQTLIHVGGGRRDHVEIPIAVSRRLQQTGRAVGGRAAVVAGAVVHHAPCHAGVPFVMGDGLGQLLARLDRTLVVVVVEIVGIVACLQGYEHALAVGADPSAQVEPGQLAVRHRRKDAAVGRKQRRAGSPGELLGRKAHQTHVGFDGRQRRAKAEAVGQEDVLGNHAKFPLKPVVADQNLAHQGFAGGYVDVHRVPGGAHRVPSALFDVFLDLLEFCGIVFLHQLVAEGALKVERIEGVFPEQREVVVHGVFDAVPDGIHNRPIPLGIEMRVGNGKKFRFLFAHRKHPFLNYMILSLSAAGSSGTAPSLVTT